MRNGVVWVCGFRKQNAGAVDTYVSVPLAGDLELSMRL